MTMALAVMDARYNAYSAPPGGGGGGGYSPWTMNHPKTGEQQCHPHTTLIPPLTPLSSHQDPLSSPSSSPPFTEKSLNAMMYCDIKLAYHRTLAHHRILAYEHMLAAARELAHERILVREKIEMRAQLVAQARMLEREQIGLRRGVWRWRGCWD
jgi:hypothetical protein